MEAAASAAMENRLPERHGRRLAELEQSVAGSVQDEHRRREILPVIDISDDHLVSAGCLAALDARQVAEHDR
jgi:hypothetical protein